MHYFPIPAQLEKIIVQIPIDELKNLENKYLYPFTDSASIPIESRIKIENATCCDVYFTLSSKKGIEYTAHNIWVPRRGIRGEWIGVEYTREHNGKGERTITSLYALNNYCYLKIFQALKPEFMMELSEKYNVDAIKGRSPSQLKLIKIGRFLG